MCSTDAVHICIDLILINSKRHCHSSKQGSGVPFSIRGYLITYRKYVCILIGQFQEGFLFASFMDLITDIHRNRCTIKKTPKWAKMQFFIFMSKVTLGTLPSTQNMFSVLLESICHIKAWITNCDKSQIAMAGIPELSQFVTVAICDGSKHNFSDRFHSNRGYTPKCRKHVHIKIGPFQEGFLGTSIMGFITDIPTHKQIYQWNNTKMGKNTTFHIHVKREPGYSLKYPEHVFSSIGINMPHYGLDHKLRQITNCDGRDSWIVAIGDGSKHNFSNIFHSAAIMFTSKSDPFKKVSWVHRSWAL